MTAGTRREDPEKAVHVGTPAALVFDVEQFLRRESRLLDLGQYEEWIELFDQDHGEYWVPCAHDEIREAALVPSLVHDDVCGLRVRVEQLASGSRWVNDPARPAVRLTSNVCVTEGEDDEVDVWAALLVIESHAGEINQHAGHVEYRLKRDGDSFKIRSKTVRVLAVERGLPGYGDVF